MGGTTLPQGPTRVVVAFTSGRRLHGYTFGFSALREAFKIFPSELAKADEGEDVMLKDLKGIFFIQDPPPPQRPTMHGRELEVLFPDGEKIRGWTEGYTPDRKGFFMIPGAETDPAGKILRVFVVNANVKKVSWIRSGTHTGQTQ